MIVMRFVLGLSPREIAERIGRSEDAVHGLQHRGRITLRRELTALQSAPARARFLVPERDGAAPRQGVRLPLVASGHRPPPERADRRRGLRGVHGLGGGAGPGAVPAPGGGGDRAVQRRQRHPRHADRARASRWSPWRRTSPRSPTAARTFYTAPIKALVSEKFFALCAIFGAENVGHAHGRRVGQRGRADRLLHRGGAGQHRAARGRARPTSARS